MIIYTIHRNEIKSMENFGKKYMYLHNPYHFSKVSDFFSNKNNRKLTILSITFYFSLSH